MAGVAPIEVGDAVWDWSRPYLLGVVNVTPDSFSDGGRFFDPARARDHGLALVASGADALDVGGESTRPGAPGVDVDEELRRVIPVIEALVRATRVPISIDTTKAAVARAALDAGAVIVNDVGTGDAPEVLGAIAARRGAAYIAMHSRGAIESEGEREASAYGDVVLAVRDALRRFAARLAAVGVARERILLDPGIGFAKTAAQSLEVLANLGPLRALGHALCVGPSRKSFLVDPRAYGDAWEADPSPAADRLGGTAAAVTAAVLQGAEVLRVHDVAAMRQAARVAHGLVRAGRLP